MYYHMTTVPFINFDYISLNVMLSCFQSLDQCREAWPLLGIELPTLEHDLADLRVTHGWGIHMVALLYLHVYMTHTL